MKRLEEKSGLMANLPLVFHMGSCVDNTRIATLWTAMAAELQSLRHFWLSGHRWHVCSADHDSPGLGSMRYTQEIHTFPTGSLG